MNSLIKRWFFSVPFHYFWPGNQSVGNTCLLNNQNEVQKCTFILASISRPISWVPQKFTATERGILIRIVLICFDFISLFFFSFSPFSLWFQPSCSVFSQITGFSTGHKRKAKADEQSFGRTEKSVPTSFLWILVKH